MAKSKKGFTIIEVVLVLAIAGLIFLMVFIALPALQRSQRNTQREDDISRILTAANDYQTNNHGKTPFHKDGGNKGVDENFVKRYIDDTCTSYDENDGYGCTGDEMRDPDGTNYNMDGNTSIKDTGTDDSVIDATNFSDAKHTIHAVTYATCGDENQAVKGTGERQYALFYMLEGNSITCNDNH
ncbi:type II secretion system protein [Candidatus Saccharibacteria bacterium]|nr:type II secretion system protein [Candidatus Saccharibacteria bacterium]MBR6961947.1 type II secretion system protein [Candidatus Saccharibacteria bacterium]